MLPPFRYRGKTLETSTTGSVHDSFASEANAHSLISYAGIGQSWDSGSAPVEVTGVTFKLRGRGYTQYGLLRVHIYAHSGTFGTDGIPTGDPLVSSDFFEIDTLSGTHTDHFFPLSGWTPSANTDYVAAIEFHNMVGIFNSDAEIFLDSSGTHEGNIARQDKTNLDWTGSNLSDATFAVYMDTNDVEVLVDTAALTLTTHQATISLDVEVLVDTAELTLTTHGALVDDGIAVGTREGTASSRSRNIRGWRGP